MKTNRLEFETSPYLKQHENNPVDWFPWGEEALTRSRLENKPILLSVGYSSCHWCHVMAHESFENEAIASIMNEHFVCVKVDREERPDLDMIYQPVAQVFTRSGGWPLTVFLTPDLKPFYGGTYFPPVDKYGRPGFPKVLLSLAKTYQEKRDEVNLRADKITEVIRNSSEAGGALNDADFETLNTSQVREGLIRAAQTLVGYVDPEHGGIGSAPKFPNTSALSFLWRMSLCSWVSDEDRKQLKESVLKSLDGMARGGIFDQIGGGFHRYSVDAEWVIPHYEKMLYDNGLLLKLYSEVICTSELEEDRTSLYARTLMKTIHWIETEMKTPEGFFYSALDADSLNFENHHEEGAYYTWAEDEFTEAQGGTGDEVAAFRQMLTGLTEEGRHGLTLQRFPRSITATPLLENLMKKLSQIRSKRARPGLDDKVLTSWTALAMSGLSWASLALRVLDDPESSLKTRNLAIEAWNAIQKHAHYEGKLYSTVQKGKAKFNAYLDDEAFLLMATLDLARAHHEKASEYLAWVEKRIPQVIENYGDPKRGGFFFNQKNSDDAERLIHQPKNFYDQAIPSGNGTLWGVMAALETEHALSDFSFLLRSQEMNPFENAFGMSEILNALLLKTVGPVKVEGDQVCDATLEVLSHPFAFWMKHSSHAQYCSGQTCHAGKFVPKDFF